MKIKEFRLQSGPLLFGDLSFSISYDYRLVDSSS